MENFKELEEKLSSKLSVIALESSSLQGEKVKPYLKVDAGNVLRVLFGTLIINVSPKFKH